MAISDPIADMLTRIRNGGMAKFNSIDIPGSKLKLELAKVFKNEGYIRNYKFIKDGKQGIIRIYLKYIDGEMSICKLERVSRPSRRIYKKHDEIKPVYNGTGIAVISTSKGIMTDKNARKEKVGGEVICNVW